MKLDALDHPKTNHFASLLGISRPTAIGHLELLWAFTGKMAPQGNIGKWPDGAIARACDWMGDPKPFLEALLEARLLDAHDTHRLLVHDWHVHAAGWVRAKLKNAKARFFTGVSTSEAADDLSSGSTREPTREATIQGKGREGKREGISDPDADASPPASKELPSGAGNGVPPPKARGSSRVPEDFLPDLTYARSQVPDMDVDREAQKFRDWEFKTPRKDWPATWRTWVSRCRETGKYARTTATTGGTRGLERLVVG